MISRVSSSAPNLALRQHALSLQKALATANDELSTGWRSDVGVAIGATLSRSEAARVQMQALDSLDAMDAATQARTDVISTSLKELRDGATKLRNELVAATQQTQSRDGVIAMARSFLSNFVGIMGRDVAGVAMFGGENLDAPSVKAYDPTRAAGASASVAAAFQSAFGMTQDDPNVANITRSNLETFLDGAFAQEFEPTAWAANWSNATDASFQSQITPEDSTATTLSANDKALRDMARVAVMMSDLGAANMNADAFSGLAAKGVAALTDAMSGVIRLETTIGESQNRIKASRESMKSLRDVLNTHVSNAESADPVEASATISDLQTRLQATFAVTARLKELSLLNYL